MSGFGERPEERRGSLDLTFAPGDTVKVIGGRLRGSSAVLEEIETVQTPSGGTVHVARIRRPRAGVSWEFPDMLRRSGE